MTSPESATILIVDDEESNRRLFEVFVKADGHSAIGVASGLNAVPQVLALQPDLILLDLMMPEMDGFEIARQLKLDPRTRDIPIIVLSSLNDVAARGRLSASGADEWIAKPVDRWALSRAISRLLAAAAVGGRSKHDGQGSSNG